MNEKRDSQKTKKPPVGNNTGPIKGFYVTILLLFYYQKEEFFLAIHCIIWLV
jgi:hypothetical protein